MAHRDHYLALAEAAASELIGPDQAEWLDRLDAELGNLRAATAFSQTLADPEPGLRLAASLQEFWLVRGHVAEGAGVLQTLLDAPAAREATLPRAGAGRSGPPPRRSHDRRGILPGRLGHCPR
jgi:predicted ATPase